VSFIMLKARSWTVIIFLALVFGRKPVFGNQTVVIFCFVMYSSEIRFSVIPRLISLFGIFLCFSM